MSTVVATDIGPMDTAITKRHVPVSPTGPPDRWRAGWLIY